jgi:hypothetical protein
MRYNSIKIFILFISVLSIQSCRKEIPKGQLITANGVVMDLSQQKTIALAKVYLFGGHKSNGPGGITIFYDTPPLDSVTTDANGRFTLKYVATGNSYDYALGVARELFQIGNDERLLPDANEALYKFNFAYSLNNLIINAKELNNANVTLQILSNPYDTLFFKIYSASTGQTFAKFQFFGKSIDTKLSTHCLPRSENVFEYYVRTIPLTDSGYVRLLSDTLNVGNVDTVFVLKKLNSTYEIPLKPY